MRVLVACEYSGVVREAFRARGHDAYSCDILPAEDDSYFHFQADVVNVLDLGWDLMIGHPPCTYLCNSGVSHLHLPKETQSKDEVFWDTDDLVSLHKVQERWKKLELARQFFMMLWEAHIPKIVLENPVPHKYAQLPKYDQTIQPYMFGDDASKRTCLWLKGLPKLSIPSEDLWVPPRIVDSKPRWSNQTDSGQNKLSPSSDRGLRRSRTYQGIANALAEQYG